MQLFPGHVGSQVCLCIYSLKCGKLKSFDEWASEATNQPRRQKYNGQKKMGPASKHKDVRQCNGEYKPELRQKKSFVCVVNGWGKVYSFSWYEMARLHGLRLPGADSRHFSVNKGANLKSYVSPNSRYFTWLLVRNQLLPAWRCFIWTAVINTNGS